MKKKTFLILFLIFLILSTMAFIFSRSARSIPDSQRESLLIGNFLTPFLELFVGKGSVTDHLVRKLAHFCEFGLLGVEVASLSLLCGVKVPLHAAFFSLLCALSDETIQIFFDRGSQVKDVWLDFSGAVCGIFFLYILSLLKRKLFRRKKT